MIRNDHRVFLRTRIYTASRVCYNRVRGEVSQMRTGKFMIVLMAVVLLLAAGCAQAELSIRQAYEVRIGSGDAWLSLEKHMLHAHENGMLADGILFFMPLGEYVAAQDVPEMPWSAETAYQVIAADPAVTLSVGCVIYDGSFQPVASEDTGLLPAEGLPAGRYLLSIDVAAQAEARSASTRSFVWLIIGESKIEADGL